MTGAAVIECLVLGGGPAGLTATIYLARYRRTVLVTDGGKSRPARIPKSHNYPGFKGIAGPELLARLREQAQMYGAVSTIAKWIRFAEKRRESSLPTVKRVAGERVRRSQV